MRRPLIASTISASLLACASPAYAYLDQFGLYSLLPPETRGSIEEKLSKIVSDPNSTYINVIPYHNGLICGTLSVLNSYGYYTEDKPFIIAWEPPFFFSSFNQMNFQIPPPKEHSLEQFNKGKALCDAGKIVSPPEFKMKPYMPANDGTSKK